MAVVRDALLGKAPPVPKIPDPVRSNEPGPSGPSLISSSVGGTGTNSSLISTTALGLSKKARGKGRSLLGSV